jgi:hypothetical protein
MHFGKYHVQREVSLDNSGNIPIMEGMNQVAEITEHDIRQSLIARATAYATKAKTSFSAMGVAAVGDSKFLSRVQNAGIGFNIKTYQRMVEWLDEAERKLQQETAL